MALRAELITDANSIRIADLNGGQMPTLKMLDGNTFFVYRDDTMADNEILTREEFNKKFTFYTSGRYGNTIFRK